MKIAAKRKSATLLTIFGVVGLVATAVSSARAAPKAIKLLEEKGLERNDKEQTVDGYIKIYPRTFFSPYDYINGINYITDDSYSIHHFTLSWLPKSTRIKTGIKRKIIKIIGGENIKKIREKLG